jgi:2'-5' RNA ligase
MAEDYAVVSYLPGELGEFVDRLRRRFDPALAAWLPHVTLLPPRSLENALDGPLETIRRRCALFEPFDATVYGVCTFWPISGVVYLSCSAGRNRLTELHDALNSAELERQEIHPYVPHITIAQDLDEQRAAAVLADVEREWSAHQAGWKFRVESLFLVQKTPENRWLNLAPIPLGGLIAHSSR